MKPKQNLYLKQQVNPQLKPQVKLLVSLLMKLRLKASRTLKVAHHKSLSQALFPEPQQNSLKMKY